MCMLVKDLDGKVAEEDLIVFKILRKSASGELRSHYAHFSWEMNKLYEIPSDRSNKWLDYEYITDSSYRSKGYRYGIAGGVFHTYTTFEDAEDRMERILCMEWFFAGQVPNLNIYKCRIPKGTLIWEGVQSCCPSYPNICAKRLEILEELPVKYDGPRLWDL